MANLQWSAPSTESTNVTAGRSRADRFTAGYDGARGVACSSPFVRATPAGSDEPLARRRGGCALFSTAVRCCLSLFIPCNLWGDATTRLVIQYVSSRVKTNRFVSSD